MKKCTHCNKEFDDSTMFCPHCGSQLEVSKPTVISTNSNGFANWAGTILTILGLFLMWEVDWVWGAIIGAMGVISGIKSSNSVNKAISCMAGVVGVLLIFIYIL